MQTDLSLVEASCVSFARALNSAFTGSRELPRIESRIALLIATFNLQQSLARLDSRELPAKVQTKITLSSIGRLLQENVQNLRTCPEMLR